MINENKIMKLMNEIKYGFIDRNVDNYFLQSPEMLLETKVGLCWDQVELERYYFKNSSYKVKTFFIVNNDKNNYCTHTFLAYESRNMYYWFEHSWEKYKGIYQYNNINDLFKDIKDKFCVFNNGNLDSVFIYEYDEPNYKISSQEFINHCQNGKLVMDYTFIYNNLDKLHTTKMGIDRIKKNIGLYNIDVMTFLKEKIRSDNIYFYKKGKNYYCEIDNIIITINSYNFSVITVHQL